MTAIAHVWFVGAAAVEHWSGETELLEPRLERWRGTRPESEDCL